MVVDKGDAPPVRVTGPEHLVLDVSAARRQNNTNSMVRGWWVEAAQDAGGRARRGPQLSEGPTGWSLILSLVSLEWRRTLPKAGASRC